ncbi:hypothetical protein JQ543_21345 [Bradyrhizobium diazoefficiens]|nr:hypothetical protein [Bradyrhizobium diazoefficiens]MBR0850304.1 hypothetical protein [Bradyrhizobium diazoefficiens]
MRYSLGVVLESVYQVMDIIRQKCLLLMGGEGYRSLMGRGSEHPGAGRHDLGLGLLLVTFVAMNCISLVAVQRAVGVMSDIASVATTSWFLVALPIPFLLFSRFSFGYIVGVSFYGVIAGFVWITHFTSLNYDHQQARLAAVASLLAFLLPVLLQRQPLRFALTLSSRSMDRLLVGVLWGVIVVLVLDASHGVAFVGIDEAVGLRDRFPRPAILNYLTGSLVGGALPFSFAYFTGRQRYALAALSLALIPLFYPILLSKTVLLAAVWLPFLYWMFVGADPRRAAVLTWLLPMAAGLAIYAILGPGNAIAEHVFGWINTRLYAVPSIAMNYYSEFFASHKLTGFCQINIVRVALGCPYFELGPVLAAQYGVGNLNASLFATEGIASVGAVWSPVSAFVCGVIVSLGNSVSARHASPLIAASSGVVVQSLLNVPLSISLLSGGYLVLMLLWSVAPDSNEGLVVPKAAGSGRSERPSRPLRPGFNR